MTTFIHTTTTFLQVFYPTRFRSVFFTSPYKLCNKNPFGLYERSCHPPPTLPASNLPGPPPPGLPPHPLPGPTCPYPARPPGPPLHPPTPAGPRPKCRQRAAPQPRSPRVERHAALVSMRRAARRLDPAHMCAWVQSMLNDIFSAYPTNCLQTPALFSPLLHPNPPSFLQNPASFSKPPARSRRRGAAWGRRGRGVDAAWGWRCC